MALNTEACKRWILLISFVSLILGLIIGCTFLAVGLGKKADAEYYGEKQTEENCIITQFHSYPCGKDEDTDTLQYMYHATIAAKCDNTEVKSTKDECAHKDDKGDTLDIGQETTCYFFADCNGFFTLEPEEDYLDEAWLFIGFGIAGLSIVFISIIGILFACFYTI